jgi:hypothetical protein
VVLPGTRSASGLSCGSRPDATSTWVQWKGSGLSFPPRLAMSSASCANRARAAFSSHTPSLFVASRRTYFQSAADTSGAKPYRFPSAVGSKTSRRERRCSNTSPRNRRSFTLYRLDHPDHASPCTLARPEGREVHCGMQACALIGLRLVRENHPRGQHAHASCYF